MVIDCIAITLPFITDVVPKVAELPTCQKIFDANAPPARITLRPEVVVKVVAICIMNRAFAVSFRVKSQVARRDCERRGGATIDGRLLARTGSVTLAGNTIVNQ
jgi:hypothetical protein